MHYISFDNVFSVGFISSSRSLILIPFLMSNVFLFIADASTVLSK